MAPGQNMQLESAINEALKSGDVQPLDVFLQREDFGETPIKCSQQFLTKLDKLVNKSLDEKDPRAASLCFFSLHKCGKNLKLPGCGGQGLSRLMQSLIKKWFEKCRQLWIQCGPQWDDSLFTLSEDFLNALIAAHEASKEGTYKITESFLYPVGQLAVDPRIYILIQKEAIRKFNFILDKIPVELKKDRMILTSQEASDIMMKLAGQIMEGGDYDFQSSVMEALCRMTTPEQRKKLAYQWFSMECVASAFAKIRDSEFETACRKFLNMVNGMQGDKRRVKSYPCLEVYLDNYELLMPTDEKLEEFWIDFNLGSHSISFYFSLADEEAQEGHWETISINENEVVSYTVTEKGKRKILQVKMSEVVVVGSVEGSSLNIHFSSSLDILQAVCNIYGHSKNKATSVVKNAMEENNTQVVPESQVSISGSEKNTAPYLPPAPSASAQMETPAKMRISQATTFINVSGGGTVHSGKSLAAMPGNTPAKGKDKPSLEMVHSRDSVAKTYIQSTTSYRGNTVGMKEQSTAFEQAVSNKIDKHKKNISVSEAVTMVQTGQEEEKSLEQNFVPDTQPRSGRNMSSSWNKLSISEMLMMPTQKIGSLPRPEPCSSLSGQQERQPSSARKWSVSASTPICQKQLHIEVTTRLQQILDEKNKDPAPQEPAVPQRKMSNSRGDSKERSSGDQHTSKRQQVQRNGHAKEKSKSHTSLELDAIPLKASVKTTSKTLQERTPPVAKIETNKALSKEKRVTEVVSSIKLIPSHYESKAQSTEKYTAENPSWIPRLVNRPIFNMSWLSTTKKEIFGAGNHSKTTRNSFPESKDVYAFSIDAPLHIGEGDKTFTDSSGISHSGLHNSSILFGSTKKGQPVEKKKRYVKKHLFSDTDTDNAMTEISWLRESNRKPKPQINKYSRQAPTKPTAVQLHSSYESQDLPLLSPDNNKPSKKKPYLKKALDQPKKPAKPIAAATAPSRPHAACNRVKRAAAKATKNYKEPDTDDSQSEPEKPPLKKSSSVEHLETTEKSHETAEMKMKKTVSKQPTKSYMKLGSESVSEKQPTSKKYFVGQQQRKSEDTCSEVPVVKKKKHTILEQSTESFRKQESSNQSDLKKPSGPKLRPEMVFQETSKLKKNNVIAAQEQMSTLKASWATRQAFRCLSPPFIEKMRFAERSASTLDWTCSPLLTPRGSPHPASPKSPCLDTPSPVLLLPKPRSPVSSKTNCKPSSLYSTEKNHSSPKTQSIQSVSSPTSLGGQTPAPSPPTEPCAAEMSTAHKHLSSAPRSPLSLSTLPLLTSTVIEQVKLPMHSPAQTPFLEDTFNDDHYDFSKLSSVSQVSLSQSSTKSSVLTSRVKDSPAVAQTVSLKTEKTPPSAQGLKLAQIHVSGPSRKRYFSSSNSEEDEKKERKISKARRQRFPRMKPRKLFKSFTEVSALEELNQVMPSSHMTSHYWEAEVVDGDMDTDEDVQLPEIAVNPSNLCQQFSSELKKKFESHYKMMEAYNKQSLKTVQQHISSINTQVTKYRTQRIEQVQKVLLEEIYKLEQDDAVLKSMEKDLATYWKKQTVAFHSYQKQETRRNKTLKRSFQSNACHSLECEERIFTTQMCVMRKDMKSVQDRLLSEMQEKDIQSVKQGLHALFFP